MLKVVYENKADIPAGLEPYYAEKDGKFVLQADGMKTESDVEAVSAALDKERKARRDAEAKAADLDKRFGLLPDDFDADAYNALVDSASGKDVDAKLKAQRESIEAMHAKEKQALQAENEKLGGLVDKHVKAATLRSAMTEANIGKAFMPAVEAMFSSQIKIEGEDVFLNEKPVSDALKEWAGTDDGKHYVAADANSGGGSDGAGSGGNAGKQTMTREQFDALDAASKMDASQKGVVLTD